MSEGQQPPTLRVVLGDGDDAEPPTPHSVPEAVKQPAYGVRAGQPGMRGCWALKRDGEICRAARRADSDYCNAHSGIGVASDPEGHSRVGRVASADSRRRRAALRLELGITRPTSIRGMLRAAVWAERERVVASALAGLDDSSPSRRTTSALSILNAVEPQPKAALDIPLPTDPDGVEGLSLAELRSLAEQVGITPTPPSPAIGT